jgi:hypothetical protein
LSDENALGALPQGREKEGALDAALIAASRLPMVDMGGLADSPKGPIPPEGEYR